MSSNTTLLVTMEAHEAKRAFVRYSKTKSANDYEFIEVGFGLYNTEQGGTLGEMGVVWKDISRKGKLVPCLHAWHDSWIVLNSFVDVIAALAQDEKNRRQGDCLSEPEFVDLLLSLGFVDLTPYP